MSRIIFLGFLWIIIGRIWKRAWVIISNHKLQDWSIEQFPLQSWREILPTASLRCHTLQSTWKSFLAFFSFFFSTSFISGVIGLQLMVTYMSLTNFTECVVNDGRVCRTQWVFSLNPHWDELDWSGDSEIHRQQLGSLIGDFVWRWSIRVTSRDPLHPESFSWQKKLLSMCFEGKTDKQNICFYSSMVVTHQSAELFRRLVSRPLFQMQTTTPLSFFTIL